MGEISWFERLILDAKYFWRCKILGHHEWEYWDGWVCIRCGKDGE